MNGRTPSNAQLDTPFHALLLNFVRNPHTSLSFGTLLQFLFCDQSSLPGCITNHDTSFLHTLNVTLEVAADSVTHGNERELVRIKLITVSASEFDETLRERVIILLLLHGVVEGGVTEVFLAVVNEEIFELSEIFCEGEME